MTSETSNPTRIELIGAGKRYGATPIFQNLNFSVGAHEVLAIIGPSGCGKTTLLRCLDGLMPLNEGQLLFEGKPLLGPTEGVAMVFQQFGLFPWKTVFDNVAYGLKLTGVKGSALKDKVRACIDMVGLKGYDDYYPHQISGGMQQRCGLARALAVEPRVLLMDEPFGAVDSQTREILQFELLRIWERTATTMIFVTHSIEEAVLMGDRIMILKGRPSSVAEIISVDLPRPRDRSTLSLPRFAELREQVWNSLKNEVAQADKAVLTAAA
jgi:NitT/TauT family transport system ATP-binding protein